MAWIKIDPEELKQAARVFMSCVTDFNTAENRAYAAVQGPGLGRAGPAAIHQMGLSTQAGMDALIAELKALIAAVQEANALLASEQTPPAAAVQLNASRSGPFFGKSLALPGEERPAWTQGLTDAQLLKGATMGRNGPFDTLTLSNGVTVLNSKELTQFVYADGRFQWLNGAPMDNKTEVYGVQVRLERNLPGTPENPPPAPLPVTPSRAPADQKLLEDIVIGGMMPGMYNQLAQAEARIDANWL